MKPKFTAQVIATTLALSSIVVFKAQAAPPTVAFAPTVAPAPATPAPTAPAAPQGVTISCEGRNTVVRKGLRQAVLITWNTNYFGPQYTPEQRCQIVSNKLQNVATANGGTLKGLNLRSGPVNGQVVICALTGSQIQCDASNMLFTLKPENARQPGAVIQQIITFSQTGSGTINEDSGEEVTVDLGIWEERAFPPESLAPASVPPSSPVDTDTGF